MVVHLALYLVSSQAEDIKVLGDKRKIRFLLKVTLENVVFSDVEEYYIRPVLEHRRLSGRRDLKQGLY